MCKNPEKQKAASVARYKINPEKQKAASVARYKINPEKQKVAYVAGYKINPEKQKTASLAKYKNILSNENPSLKLTMQKTKRAYVNIKEVCMYWLSQSLTSNSSVLNKCNIVCYMIHKGYDSSCL